MIALLWLRAHWRTVAIAGAAIVLALFIRCRPDPAPLPPALERQVERHALATAVDTAEIHRLKVVADTLKQQSAAAARRAAQSERTAVAEHRRADSLAAAAAAASSARDSATLYHAALDVRTTEVQQLQAALVEKDTSIAKATRRGDSLEVALGRSERRAARADTVLASAVDVVRHSDPPCRVLYVFGCPSRTAVAVTAGVLGAAAAVAATIYVKRRIRRDDAAVVVVPARSIAPGVRALGDGTNASTAG
jgi:hypothetical protein